MPTAANNDGYPLRANILSCMKALSHTTTPFIATFLLIHLAAPVMANIGGSSLSSQTMILGREYYQGNKFVENFLVLGAIGVHGYAGLARRLIPSQKTSPRSLKSLLAVTGYAAFFILVPLHFSIHRLYPTSISPSISTVGPSELDYEFVKYGLHKWPLRSWLLYAGTVISVSLHVADGVAILWRTYFKNIRSRSFQAARKCSKTTNRLTMAVIGVVLPVLGGVYTIASEQPKIFLFLAKRYEAVFKIAYIYRF